MLKVDETFVFKAEDVDLNIKKRQKIEKSQ